MILLDQARALLLDGVSVLGTEEVMLDQAAGRVLAADLIARDDQPRDAVSAMDGYAIADGDAVDGACLRLIGTAYAGSPFAGRVEPGTAVRIATGSVLPDGASRVIMQEVVTADGATVVLSGPLHAERFVRPAGGDYRRGERLLAAGTMLSPGAIGLASAANQARLAVRKVPRVALFASGDELREPGAALAKGQAIDSAGPALAALVAAWGGRPDRLPILPDDPAAIRRAIEATSADVLLFIGGASVGDRDHLRAVAAGLGAAPRFDRIAVQPGKPCWHARMGDGRMLLGLPGNPASAFVCAHLLVEPLLAALLGRPAATLLRATLAAPLAAAGPRETYWRASAALADGRLMVTPDLRRDSSLQRPLAAANALLRQPPGSPALDPGTMVDILPLCGARIG